MRSQQVALVGALVLGCSARSRSAFFEEGPEAGIDSGPAASFGEPTCNTLECKQVRCEGAGVTTTLRGRVYDPAGANGLYNVMVYVPSGGDRDGPLPRLEDSLTDGVSCQPCSSVVVNPLVSALTDATGEFELKNVPVDDDVPVIVQLGKWRRRFYVDVTKKCTDNTVTDRMLLPALGAEGDMPHIAVATGNADALECLLHGIGIAASEFVRGDDPRGHVHVYNGYHEAGGGFAGAPDAGLLWNNLATLRKFDVTLLSCEGEELTATKTNPDTMPAYLDAGGRLYATHFHYTWFNQSPVADIRAIATFNVGEASLEATSGEHDVDMTFPKGEALAHWLSSVGGSDRLGKLPIDSSIRNSVKSVAPPGIAWITSPMDRGAPRYFSFNTPIHTPPESQCGRAVFSDLHIAMESGPRTISQCGLQPGRLNPQQMALEFLLFDLSACISDDRLPPQLPR